MTDTQSQMHRDMYTRFVSYADARQPGALLGVEDLRNLTRDECVGLCHDAMGVYSDCEVVSFHPGNGQCLVSEAGVGSRLDFSRESNGWEAYSFHRDAFLMPVRKSNYDSRTYIFRIKTKRLSREDATDIIARLYTTLPALFGFDSTMLSGQVQDDTVIRASWLTTEIPLVWRGIDWEWEADEMEMAIEVGDRVYIKPEEDDFDPIWEQPSNDTVDDDNSPPAESSPDSDNDSPSTDAGSTPDDGDSEDVVDESTDQALPDGSDENPSVDAVVDETADGNNQVDDDGDNDQGENVEQDQSSNVQSELPSDAKNDDGFPVPVLIVMIVVASLSLAALGFLYHRHRARRTRVADEEIRKTIPVRVAAAKPNHKLLKLEGGEEFQEYESSSRGVNHVKQHPPANHKLLKLTESEDHWKPPSQSPFNNSDISTTAGSRNKNDKQRRSSSSPSGSSNKKAYEKQRRPSSSQQDRQGSDRYGKYGKDGRGAAGGREVPRRPSTSGNRYNVGNRYATKKENHVELSGPGVAQLDSQEVFWKIQDQIKRDLQRIVDDKDRKKRFNELLIEWAPDKNNQKNRDEELCYKVYRYLTDNKKKLLFYNR